MPIIGIEGGISQGKSVALTYFGLEEHVNLGKHIFSNFRLYGVPYTLLTFDDLLEMAESKVELENAVILIDEAHIWFDSRASASKLNRTFSYFVLQTGKQDINLYWASQDAGQVDPRLRKRTDIAIVVRAAPRNQHVLRCVEMSTGKTYSFCVNGPDVWSFYRTKEVISLHRTKK